MIPLHSIIKQSVKLFLGLTLIVSALCTLSSCIINVNTAPDTITGNGRIATVQRNPGNFSAITISIPGTIEIVNKLTPGIEITADENIIPLIKTEISGSTLSVSSFGTSFHSSQVRIKISATMVDRVENFGSANVSVVLIDTPAFIFTLAGSGNTSLSGTTQSNTVNVTGSGNVSASLLHSSQAIVRISGSGNASIFASQVLDATISGSGNIFYYGNPPTIRRSITGSGNIIAGR